MTSVIRSGFAAWKAFGLTGNARENWGVLRLTYLFTAGGLHVPRVLLLSFSCG